ncbi:MAG: ATPase [Lachnospiraceae bacterium]|nr:ATPase [Lachnospiraceae bacterium]
MANKKYETCVLEEYIQELSQIENFLSKYHPPKSKTEALLEDEAFFKLFSLNYNITDEDLKNWTDEKYIKNPKYPDQLQHKCLSGEYVRSKSEVIIANMLFTNHIPYRYECLLTLGNTSFYPDFTILNPSTHQIIYWEHFGMMDVPTYSDNAFNKLKQFSYYGIIPGINLITTYETRQNPIDSEKIMQLVNNHFNI